MSGYLDSTSVTALVATAERLFATTSTLIHPDDSYGRTSCSLYLDSNGLYSNGCGLCPDAVTVPDALKNDGTCNALKCSLVSWSMADLLPGGGLATAARDTLIDRTCGRTQDGAAVPGGSASIMYVTGMTVVDSSIYMSDFYSGGVRLLADGVVSTLLDGEGNTGDDISARDPSASPYGDSLKAQSSAGSTDAFSIALVDQTIFYGTKGSPTGSTPALYQLTCPNPVSSSAPSPAPLGDLPAGPAGSTLVLNYPNAKIIFGPGGECTLGIVNGTLDSALELPNHCRTAVMHPKEP